MLKQVHSIYLVHIVCTTTTQTMCDVTCVIDILSNNNNNNNNNSNTKYNNNNRYIKNHLLRYEHCWLHSSIVIF